MQLVLFTVTDCDNGRHRLLLDEAPQMLEGCVNVETRCEHCGRVIRVVSWTTAAWQKQQEKQR